MAKYIKDFPALEKGLACMQHHFTVYRPSPTGERRESPCRIQKTLLHLVR